MNTFLLMEHVYHLGRAGEGATYASAARYAKISKYHARKILEGFAVEGLAHLTKVPYRSNAVTHRYKLNGCGVSVFRAYRASVDPAYGTQL